MKYRKKPVVVEAIQLTNKNLLEVKEWCNGELVPNAETSRYDLYISTLEGIMHADINDYIIQGVEGEFYPCKPDIFEKTYEVASQQSQLDDNPKIVLEWAKKYLTEAKNIAWFIEELAFLPTTGGKLRYREVAHSYESLSNKEKLDLLNTITLWALEQEEAE
ncbi:TPA: hypothetical protein ACF5NR_000356 [Enterococcus hirae]